MRPLLKLGQIVATPRAILALNEAGSNGLELFSRHMRGDWGGLGAEDKRENDLSVRQGFRILSAYILNMGVKIWIITEADRSATRFLLPDEYKPRTRRSREASFLARLFVLARVLEHN